MESLCVASSQPLWFLLAALLPNSGRMAIYKLASGSGAQVCSPPLSWEVGQLRGAVEASKCPYLSLKSGIAQFGEEAGSSGHYSLHLPGYRKVGRVAS